MHKKSPSPPDALLLTIEESRLVLGYGLTTFQRLLRSGDIPVVRHGKRGVRIRRADLENYVEQAAEPWSEGAAGD